MKVEDLKQDGNNYRRHSSKNKKMIRKSIDQCGLGRSVVIDADGVLVAGNGVASVVNKDTPIRVVETDGSELVVVKRTDLHEGDEKRKLLALADNATADAVEWNNDTLRADWDDETLQDWDVLVGANSATSELSKLEFIDMYYEPKELPNIKLEDCFDTTKFDAKVKAIEEMDLSKKQKEVLKMFAYRFIKIDFESVANYYAFNATDEEKKAIERLRLVLVDNGLDGFIGDDMLKITDMMLYGENE